MKVTPLYHRALLGISSPYSSGLDPLIEVCKALRGSYKVVGVSSIYLCSQEEQMISAGRRTEFIEKTSNMELCFSLVLETAEGLDNFERKLESILSGPQKQLTGFGWRLLAFDNLAEFSGRRQLPHPDLHGKTQFLITSQEVWPDYFHKVLNQTLSQISGQAAFRGEFFAQGKNLLS